MDLINKSTVWLYDKLVFSETDDSDFQDIVKNFYIALLLPSGSCMIECLNSNKYTFSSIGWES